MPTWGGHFLQVLPQHGYSPAGDSQRPHCPKSVESSSRNTAPCAAPTRLSPTLWVLPGPQGQTCKSTMAMGGGWSLSGTGLEEGWG